MLYVSIFILLIAAIAIVTHRLNSKAPCEHTWKEAGNSFKCSKCDKKIPDYTPVNTDSYIDAA